MIPAEDVAEEFAGEMWTFEGKQWPGVVVQGLSAQTVRIPGGKRREGECRVQVRRAIIELSGVGEGKVITVRGEQVRVNQVETHTPTTRVLVCGPVGVRVG